jgi:hypothetical protein
MQMPSKGVELMSKHISRRGVLIGAAAVTGVSTLGTLAHVVGRDPPITLLVTDARLEESRQFAARVARSARRQFSLGRDVPRHVYAALCHSVKADRGVLTGLTTLKAFEVMQSCAAEAGFACRSQHRSLTADGGVTLVAWEFAPVA